MSKEGAQTNKQAVPTPEERTAAVTAFQNEWNRAKEGVIAGNLTPERLKETANALFKNRLIAGADVDQDMKRIVNDCKAANISDNNLHKFVGAAIAVELNHEQTKTNSTGLMRFRHC